MKTSFLLLLLLPATLASAQRRDDPVRGEPGRSDLSRVEGRYEALQRDGSLRRTLRLERDGTAEVVTEAKDARRDRRGWGREDTKRYGQTGITAMQDHPVRHTGRWRWQGDDVVVQFRDLQLGEERWDAFEMKLKRDEDGLIFDRDSKAYGTYRVVFRREGDRFSNGARLGFLRFDRDSLAIESVDLVYGRRGTGRLRIRAGGRTIELQGDALRDGNDVVTFRLPDGAGEYRLTMRDLKVDRISGRGDFDRHHIEFSDRADRG